MVYSINNNTVEMYINSGISILKILCKFNAHSVRAMIFSRLNMFVFSVIAASAYFEEKEKVAHPTNGALNDTQQG